MFIRISVNICKRPASGIQDSKCLVLSCSAAGLVHSKNMLDNRNNTDFLFLLSRIICFEDFLNFKLPFRFLYLSKSFLTGHFNKTLPLAHLKLSETSVCWNLLLHPPNQPTNLPLSTFQPDSTFPHPL